MADRQVIRLICPKLTCRAIMSVPPKARGREVKCHQCGSRIRVPAVAKPRTNVAD